MKSYTIGRNLAGVLTKNTTTTNLSFLDQMANDDYRSLCAMHDWPWLERLRTKDTIADTASVELPYDCDKVRTVSVDVDDVIFSPKEVASRKFWDKLTEVESSSDTPEWWYVFDNKLYLYPTPATAGNTINIVQKTRVKDLSIADYTTGNILTTVNSDETITGSGTSWNASMVGSWIRITSSSSANGGDGLWYEISSVTSTTVLELVKPYGGTAITAGSADYIIGQMSLLPENFQDMPWIYASACYWQKESDSRAVALFTQHGTIGSGSYLSTGKVQELEKSSLSDTTSYVLDDGEDDTIINPNLIINI